MTDFLREVDEDLRRERIKGIWSRYRVLIVGAAVGLVVAVAAFGAYEYWQTRRAAATGDRFATAMDYIREGNGGQAEAAFNRLITEGTGQYPALAALRVATAKADSGDATGAAADFDRIANDEAAPELLRNVARIRAAMVLLDTTSYDDLRPRLEVLALPEAPFRFTAQELLGLSAYRNGNLDEAERYFQQLVDADGAPEGMGERAGQMLDLIAARRTPATPEG